ncbi:hypothetical protein HBH70_007990 [Parastagonospora nodorum]|uniref:Uncharacterized protein n=1 Tax=Phaeosphaeria nodorum (strain SN15 / ATCC MYA-4574 / FGSC 10173) TaxID=321614 RepID=A0A7U2EQN2_PHANO|nr:hypothetical protein HBH53_076640 [Parastagonospora nodorum]QRC91007.1 hypothetical protein JI435_426270 [Parastagonospora nodorum SN15]KAH3987404.1 hypothetical protein HBH52_037700 [Parastagonospora nodorum]KAH4042068.1 hypothetical protein HBI09_008310 [Parastagonospora nodorum]KAH4060767.1 hypothetical protein HBH49_006330 [Parastagonospora nodorum]
MHSQYMASPQQRSLTTNQRNSHGDSYRKPYSVPEFNRSRPIYRRPQAAWGDSRPALIAYQLESRSLCRSVRFATDTLESTAHPRTWSRYNLRQPPAHHHQSASIDPPTPR